MRVIGCVSAAFALLSAVGAAQMTDVKTGTWEVTTRAPQISPEPAVDRVCVTASDLAQFAQRPDGKDDRCRYSKGPSVAGKTWSAEQVCPDGSTSTLNYTADSPERVRGTIVASQGRMTMNIDLSAKWLAARCEP